MDPCKNETKQERVKATGTSDSLTDIFSFLHSFFPAKVTIPKNHEIADPNDNQFSSETPRQEKNSESSVTAEQENNSETEELAQIPEALYGSRATNSESLVTTVQKINVMFDENLKETFAEMICLVKEKKSQAN